MKDTVETFGPKGYANALSDYFFGEGEVKSKKVRAKK